MEYVISKEIFNIKSPWSFSVGISNYGGCSFPRAFLRSFAKKPSKIFAEFDPDTTSFRFKFSDEGDTNIYSEMFCMPVDLTRSVVRRCRELEQARTLPADIKPRTYSRYLFKLVCHSDGWWYTTPLSIQE